MTGHIRYWPPLALATIALFVTTQSRSEAQQDLLFFLSADPTYHETTPDDGLQGYELNLDADILYSRVNGRFRLLGEVIAATDETELERLQLGWQGSAQSIVWGGRFHSPSRYWNIAYHHGQYLQTSISRPLIEQFEDDGGILPAHETGLLLETAHKLKGTAGLRTVFSFGAAPVIDNNELKPFDLLDPDSDNSMGADMRIAYLPDELGENQAGVALSWTNLEVDGSHAAEQAGLRRVEQYAVGAYLDWRWHEWRLITGLTSVVNRMQRLASNQTDSFISGYLQTEYATHHDWTLFGRLEDTSHRNDSDYLALFPNSITRRQMLGVRYDFATSQALKLEIGHAETQTDDFEQVLLQWSIVLP